MSRGINIKDQEAIDALSGDARKAADLVNQTFDEITNDIFDFESEKRVRQAGYLPSQAEEIATMLRDERIQIGQLFEFQGKQKVLTPFKTVVDAQNYVTALQDRLYEITTVDQELMASQLKTKSQEYDQHLKWFTSLSFVDLIKMAFTKLFTNLKGTK